MSYLGAPHSSQSAIADLPPYWSLLVLIGAYGLGVGVLYLCCIVWIGCGRVQVDIPPHTTSWFLLHTPGDASIICGAGTQLKPGKASDGVAYVEDANAMLWPGFVVNAKDFGPGKSHYVVCGLLGFLETPLLSSPRVGSKLHAHYH